MHMSTSTYAHTYMHVPQTGCGDSRETLWRSSGGSTQRCSSASCTLNRVVEKKNNNIVYVCLYRAKNITGGHTGHFSCKFLRWPTKISSRTHSKYTSGQPTNYEKMADQLIFALLIHTCMHTAAILASLTDRVFVRL